MQTKTSTESKPCPAGRSHQLRQGRLVVGRSAVMSVMAGDLSVQIFRRTPLPADLRFLRSGTAFTPSLVRDYLD